MWRERIFAELLLEFNPYHDLYGRFAHAYGGEAELKRAYVGQARMESRAAKVGLVAIKAAVADARRAAQEGGKPPQLDLKIHAKVEGGARVLSTFTSNNGKHDYRTAGVLGMRQYLLTISRHTALWKGFENATPGQIRDQFLATVGKAQPVKR